MLFCKNYVPGEKYIQMTKIDNAHRIFSICRLISTYSQIKKSKKFCPQMLKRKNANPSKVDDKELFVMEATVNGLCKAKEETEE